MKAIAVFFLFVGMVLVLQGYYSRNTCPQTVQIQYADREIIDKQYEQDSVLEKQFKPMFQQIKQG